MKKVLLVATVVRMHGSREMDGKRMLRLEMILTILRNVLFRIVTALSIFHLNDFRSNLEM